MEKRKVILNPITERNIDKALSEHSAFKKINDMLKDYNGKSPKILRIKQLVKSKLK